jgi:hypothetical protein
MNLGGFCLVIRALPELGYRSAMPQLLLMVIVAVALHLILGWPLLVGIVIAAAILTVPGLIQLFVQINDENRPAVFGIALQAVGGTIVAATIAYVGVVLAYLRFARRIGRDSGDSRSSRELRS